MEEPEVPVTCKPAQNPVSGVCRDCGAELDQGDHALGICPICGKMLSEQN